MWKVRRLCCVDHAGRRHTHWSTRCLRDVTLCRPITLLVADDALTFHSLSRDQRLACLWPQDRLNPTKPLCPPTYPPVQKAFERLFYSSATFILTQRDWTSFDLKAHNKVLMIQNINWFFLIWCSWIKVLCSSKWLQIYIFWLNLTYHRNQKHQLIYHIRTVANEIQG